LKSDAERRLIALEIAMQRALIVDLGRQRAGFEDMRRNPNLDNGG
jgi:hypothetical protein